MRRVLAGDVGGTKTLLQIVAVDGDHRIAEAEQRYASGDYSTFEQMLDEFLLAAGRPAITAACLGVAGPVIGDRAEITNLSWTIDAGELTRRFSIPLLSLVNDFYTVALGVPLLQPADLHSLNEGTRAPNAPIAILGAGTGLGEAFVVHDGSRWNVISSEGGHADFSPQDEEQTRLFLELRSRHGHVSWERVLSGMGLVNIHNFLTGVTRDYAASLPTEISAQAEAGDRVATRTFEIFADIYGAEAGNMALRALARGGVFLAGGIAAKNLGHFTNGRFLEAFLRKGRFADVMASIPIDVIVNPKVGLIGAAEAAVRSVE